MKQNENGDFVVEHHVKYKEIHGVDETVWMTYSEHKKLHNRLRKEGKCKVPPNELRKISMTAQNRTEKKKEYIKNYAKNNVVSLHDRTRLGVNVRLHEQISYNIINDHVFFCATFEGINGLGLLEIDIISDTQPAVIRPVRPRSVPMHIPDELLIKIISSGHNKTKFVRETIEEKIDRENM